MPEYTITVDIPDEHLIALRQRDYGLLLENQDWAITEQISKELRAALIEACPNPPKFGEIFFDETIQSRAVVVGTGGGLVHYVFDGQRGTPHSCTVERFWEMFTKEMQ